MTQSRPRNQRYLACIGILMVMMLVSLNASIAQQSDTAVANTTAEQDGQNDAANGDETKQIVQATTEKPKNDGAG